MIHPRRVRAGVLQVSNVRPDFGYLYGAPKKRQGA